MRRKRTGAEPDVTEFAVFDGAFDDEPVLADRPSSRPPRRTLSRRWCALAAIAALIAAAAAISVGQYRGRTVSTTVVVSRRGVANADLTGCPVGQSCTYLPLSNSLFSTLLKYFPSAVLVYAGTTFDSPGAFSPRNVVYAETPAGVHLLVVSQCVVGGDPPPTWQAVTAPKGPAVATFVASGTAPGCSVAVTATVPAGVTVPIYELEPLAGDPEAQALF